MPRFLILAVSLALLSLPLAAQDFPKAEIFGGYQYSHLEGGVNANGWNASVTGNLNHWLGVAGDFSGTYKTVSGANANAYTYTFGPVISGNHKGTVNPFVHALFGGFRLGASVPGLGSASTNGFATLVGGGVDAKVSRHLAVRIIQADWMYFRVSGQGSSKNGRVSTGIVFRF